MSAECEKCGGHLVGFMETLECPACVPKEKLEALRHATRRMLRALDGYWYQYENGSLTLVDWTDAWYRAFDKYRAQVEQLVGKP